MVAEPRRSDRGLASARLKVDRAKTHYGEAARIWNDLIPTLPKAVRTRRFVHLDTREQRFILPPFEPIPDEFALAVGDAVHNLRVALEHLAVAVVCKGGRVDPNHEGTLRNIRFPIHGSRKDLLRNIHSDVGSADPLALRLFKHLQPYKGGKGHVLWKLSHLDNTDKHRLILLVYPRGTLELGPERQVGLGFGGLGEHAFGVSVPPDVRLEDRPEVSIEPAFHESFLDHDEPVLPALAEMIQITQRVIEIFARFVWKG